MMTRFKNSWELFKASITLTFRYPKLLWFPLLTTLMSAVIAFVFISAMALPVVLHHTGYHLNQKEHWLALKDYYLPVKVTTHKSGFTATTQAHSQDDPTTAATPSASTTQTGDASNTLGVSLGSVYLAVIYFLSMFLATFFNVAFYSEIIAALEGRGVSFQRGLALAWSRLPSIIAWSVLAGIVGWIIRRIEERLPLIGRMVAGFIGLAWSIAAVFAIPVIIKEPSTRNPMTVLKQSASTLKNAWGEGLIGYIGFSAGTMVVFMSSLVLLAMTGVVALALHSGWLFVIALIFWFIGLLAMSYVSGVAGHVYRCALYRYATEGVIHEPYNQGLMDAAWKVKKGSLAQF